MGYQGFSDLKLALAAEQKSEISTETFLEQINTNDSLETIIKKQYGKFNVSRRDLQIN